ncbi:phage head-tail joining protein [Reyranella sp.]|uniref:phage head-tail joining protein n=1 Tax=Reyranella sp. TaxID=1929291 RepID=UPI003D112EB7
MTALTQSDVDKLERAIATGALRVSYSSGSVEYRSLDEMMRALAFAQNQLLSSAQQGTPSTLAVFGRDC